MRLKNALSMALPMALSVALPVAALMTVSRVALGDDDHMYMGHMGACGWGGMILGPIMLIVFIAAIVAVVVLLVRWLSRPGQGGAHLCAVAKAPLDILKERFAKGEIDSQEFEELRRVLGD